MRVCRWKQMIRYMTVFEEENIILIKGVFVSK